MAMSKTRRSWLKGSGLGLLGGGFLSRVDKVSALQSGPSLRSLLDQQAKAGRSEACCSRRSPARKARPRPPADRLTLDWNKATVKRFKDTLAARDIQAFLVRDPLNIIYLTGYWHTTTERPQATFMNKDDADPWFMYPGLDRDSVTTWWFGGGRMYFDFLHGEGAAPARGQGPAGRDGGPLPLHARGHQGAQGPGHAHRHRRRAVPLARWPRPRTSCPASSS